MRYIISIIIFTLPFVFLSDSDDPLEYVAHNYQKQLCNMIFSTPISIAIDDFVVSIPFYQMIVRSMTKRITIKYITFTDIKLSFFFDIVIANKDDVSYLKKGLMIESTFGSMTFTRTIDGTFYFEFNNKNQCDYFFNDVFDSELFLSIETIKITLCSHLMSNLITSMKNYVRIDPYSKREQEFVLFNNAIINMSTKRPFMVSYRLNETFVISELTYNNFTYGRLEKGSDKTSFALVKVDVTYLMTNTTYNWFNRTTGSVVFKDLVLDDDNKYTFSKMYEGNKYIAMLIVDLFIKTNNNRKR